jgi:AcrR family transcriptional regulator
MARPSQRQVLLDAAVELHADGGSRGTSLASIAERAGVTAPAITHHFGSKRGLLLAIVDELDRRDAEVLAPRGGTGLERLDSLRGWTRAVTADARSTRLAQLRAVLACEALDHDYPARDRLIERNRRLRDTIRRVLEAGQSDGSIRVDLDADELAIEIIAAFQGCQLQWLLEPDAVDLVAVVDRYVDRLLVDLSPPADRPSAEPTSGARP